MFNTHTFGGVVQVVVDGAVSSSFYAGARTRGNKLTAKNALTYLKRVTDTPLIKDTDFSPVTDKDSAHLYLVQALVYLDLMKDNDLINKRIDQLVSNTEMLSALYGSPFWFCLVDVRDGMMKTMNIETITKDFYVSTAEYLAAHPA